MCDVKPDHILKSVLRASLIVEVKCCLPIFQLAENNSTVKSAVLIDEAYPAHLLPLLPLFPVTLGHLTFFKSNLG